jgi:2-polyprenyl-3-methyl-5-hydroxy-6-metoxy-1,4-benzoquinol methylase
MDPQPITILSSPEQYTFENRWYYEIARVSHFWIEGRFKNFLNFINEIGLDSSRPLKGLEIGCGNSVVRLQIEQHTAWQVDGSDLDLFGLKLAKKGRGCLYLYDVLEKNPLFHEQYDFLILFDVIEHIPDVTEFLSACLFHLKKGGYIFINVPALQGLFSVYDKVQGHQRRYDIKSLEKQLKSCSLKILNIHYWGLFLVPLVFIRKILPISSKNPETVIRAGFQPSSPRINGIFRSVLALEARIFSRPFVGTSLMAAAKKT